MKSVMVFGTFDRLHKGHEFFLREARKQGDRLLVVVARDATVRDVKGREPSDGEGKRKGNVEKTGIADEVVLGSLGDKYREILKRRPDVICLGYDQRHFADRLKDELERMGIRPMLVRIGAFRPDKYKTSLMGR